MGDGNLDKSASKQPIAPDGSHSLLDELHVSTSFRQSASDFGSSMAAGTAGAVAFSLLANSGVWGKALSIPVSMVAGGLTKYGVKTGLQDAMLAQQDRTVSATDLIWGGFDGLAGVAAGAADRAISKPTLRWLGRQELGKTISADVAETVGQQMVKGSALHAIGYNAVRGVVGGAAGSAAWSLPHRSYEAYGELQSNPSHAGQDFVTHFALDTVIGAAAGGVIGGALTALHRTPEIIGRTAATVQGDSHLLQMNEHAMNDIHSNIDMLPQAMTKHNELAGIAEQQGIQTRFNIAGDQYSGHVNAAFTRGGDVENRAIVKMGADNLVPGNHEYDAAGGSIDVERYPAVMAPILKENPQVSLLNANLDVSAYPDYAASTKPYVVHEVMGPNGLEKVATVGLSTEEGAVGQIKYNDAAQTAVNTVRELNGQGIKNIMLLTHLGLEEDQKVARTLLDNDLVVAKITGGHSHDITATPLWVSNKNTLLDRLQFWKPEKAIPITQGGSGGQWFSENHIAFNADGSANRWRTTGRLHSLTGVAPDQSLQSYISSLTTDGLQGLKDTTYGASTVSEYSLNGMRRGENALGNLVADSNLYGMQKRLGPGGPQIALVQPGSIKSGLSGENISRRDLANLFINAGNLEDEQKDLALANMTGSQIKAALEYGAKEVPGVERPGLASRISNILSPKPEPVADLNGNFLQVSGLKFDLDYSKPPLARVSNLQVRTPDGEFSPLVDSQHYNVLTRNHALEKWHQDGLFGNTTLTEAREQLSAQPIAVSQVDMLGDFISGRQLNPAVDSNVEGRINDISPDYGSVVAPPSRSVSGFAFVSALPGNEQHK